MTALSPVWTEPNGDHLTRFFGGTSEDEELAIVKEYMRRAGQIEDSVIKRIMPSAAHAIERAVRRPVRKRKFYSYLDRPPQGGDWIELPYTPIISVDALEALENGVWTAVDPTRYRTIRTWNDEAPPPAGPTLVEPAGDGWGEIECDAVVDAFRVSWTGGWDPTPPQLVIAAARLCDDNYRMRGTLIDVEQYRAGTTVQSAIQTYQLPQTVRFI